MLLSYKRQDEGFVAIEVDEEQLEIALKICKAMDEGLILVRNQRDDRPHIMKVKAIRSILDYPLAESSAIVWYYDELKQQDDRLWQIQLKKWEDEINF